jgi:c-di-GMP-binding flagellar brake protein YcgR
MGRQREYTRFITEATVILKLEGDVSSGIRADLVDLSFTGISVYAPERIETDSKINFELITKFLDKPIIGKGKIRYVQETKINNTEVFKMGIEFIEIEKETILSIINRLQREITRNIKRQQF